MSLFNFLSRHIYLTAHDFLLNTSISRHLKFLEQSQWWSKDQIQAYQTDRFVKLIRHAYDQVPFYRNLYDKNGVHPDDIQSLDDIKKLPVVTKEALRNAAKKEKIAANYSHKNILRFRSSGSTGSPFEYFMCHNSYSMKYAAGIRGWGWMGYKLGDKYAKLSQNTRNTAIKKIQDGMNRNRYIFIPDLKAENIHQAIDQLNRTQPEFIRCYPDPLVFIAETILQGAKLDFKPRAINSTGNILTPEAREKIESVFQCPVYDSYSVEGSALFYQSTHSSTYLGASEQAITEIVENGREVAPGAEGLHITTDLHNYAMPFIRYDTGDRLVKGAQKVHDNRNLYAVQQIIGRDSDVLISPEGNRLIVHLFTIYFEYIESITSFQVEQTQPDEFIFRFVVTPDFNKETEQQIREYWQLKIGKNSKMIIETVDQIPVLPSGKRRFLIRNKEIQLS